MNIKDLKEAKSEAKRFIKKVNELEKRLNYEFSMDGHKKESLINWGLKESSAVKRSSMDLSRSLTKIRN
tara:strand:- start:247 stop:453 length:207 start_codon:yes stop_codon:yes gene_type:complete